MTVKTDVPASFLEAFGKHTWGLSRGDAALYAIDEYDGLIQAEKMAVTEWLVELFSEGWDYYSYGHMQMAVKTEDARFVPLLKDYYIRRRAGHRRREQIEHEGEKVWIRTDYSGDLRECRRAIRALKRALRKAKKFK